jgi:hypothetical protein
MRAVTRIRSASRIVVAAEVIAVGTVCVGAAVPQVTEVNSCILVGNLGRQEFLDMGAHYAHVPLRLSAACSLWELTKLSIGFVPRTSKTTYSRHGTSVTEVYCIARIAAARVSHDAPSVAESVALSVVQPSCVGTWGQLSTHFHQRGESECWSHGTTSHFRHAYERGPL